MVISTVSCIICHYLTEITIHLNNNIDHVERKVPKYENHKFVNNNICIVKKYVKKKERERHLPGY